MFRSSVAVAVALLNVALALGADGPTPLAESPIRLPITEAVVTPAAVTELTDAAIFVIEADVPCLVFASRVGFVTITPEAGPLRIRGLFADGTKIETRKYTAKHLWIIEPAAKGEVELIITPQNAKTEDAAVRRTLVVSGGGPRPPPKPDDPPIPDPTPAPRDITLGLIVFADVADRGPETARLLTSQYWQELRSRHRVAIYTRETNETVGKAFLAEINGATGPTLLIRNNDASQKLAVVPLPKLDEFEATVKKWSVK